MPLRLTCGDVIARLETTWLDAEGSGAGGTSRPGSPGRVCSSSSRAVTSPPSQPPSGPQPRAARKGAASTGSRRSHGHPPATAGTARGRRVRPRTAAATPARPLGEAIAGQRGNHHVKTGPADAMRGRVGQPRHQRQELGEATRPAVSQDQRNPMAAASLLVHEMHPDTVDLGAEMAEAVQPAFPRTPIEADRPVPQQLPQVTKVGALLPRQTRRAPGSAPRHSTRASV